MPPSVNTPNRNVDRLETEDKLILFYSSLGDEFFFFFMANLSDMFHLNLCMFILYCLNVERLEERAYVKPA